MRRGVASLFLLSLAFAAEGIAPPSDAAVAEAVRRMAEGDMEERDKAFRSLLAWGGMEPGRIAAFLPVAGAEDDLEMKLRCEDLRRRIPLEALFHRARAAAGFDPAVVSAIDALAGDAPRQAALDRIAESCARDIRRGVETLRIFLREDPRPPVRRMAAVALGGLKDPAAAPDLVAALSDRANEVREAVPHALAEVIDACPGPWVDEAVVPALGKVLRVDHMETVRGGAVHALGRCASRAAVRFLVEALSDEDSGVASASVGALASNPDLADAVVLDALVSRLDPADPVFLTQLIPALGRLKVPAVASRLIPFLDHADDNVRAVTAHALKKITGAPWPALTGIPKLVDEAKAWWETHKDDPRYQYRPPSGK